MNAAFRKALRRLCPIEEDGAGKARTGDETSAGRVCDPLQPVRRQAARYLQASILGTLVNFVARFPLAEVVGFEASVVLATYMGMAVVFLLSYRRAFGAPRVEAGMIGRFVLVAHVGLAVVWVGSTLALAALRLAVPELLRPESVGPELERLAAVFGCQASVPVALAAWTPRLLEGACHAFGIVLGFFVNFIGHRVYSFARATDARAGSSDSEGAATVFAVLLPLAYLALYAPYGIDTTDFGFFYGHSWRVLLGEVPFRDFYYTKPPASLYWHALWLWLTPERASVLAGKAGFLAEMLAAAWLGTLFLRRIFDFDRIGVPVPLLATAAFVFGVHSFPAMPWHTADGTLFGAAALYVAVRGRAVCDQGRRGRARASARIRDFATGALAGVLGGVAVLTKQSFLFVPVAAFLAALTFHSRRRAVATAVGTALCLGAFVILCLHAGIWSAFREQTTGGLSLHEALEAGIFIYLRQPLGLPAVAAGGWLLLELAARLRRRAPRRAILSRGLIRWLIQPVPLYFLALTVWYVHTALTSREWIGYGASWPMLLVTLGGVMTLLPRHFLAPFARMDGLRSAAARSFGPSVGFGAALALAWSTGISGGYKVPAFFAAPLLLGAVFFHAFVTSRENARPRAHDTAGEGRPEQSRAGAPLLWLALVCGVIMFRTGYERPYVFPARDMPRSSLTHDAGTVFPRLTGVLVDAQSLELLRELRDLRARYGPNYKTLPGFPLAYLLTGDRPALPAEWLQDWEINGETETVYRLLMERDIVVLFERDQLDTISPDGYARTRYTVPARVRREWRQVDETRHFVVFRRPSEARQE